MAHPIPYHFHYFLSFHLLHFIPTSFNSLCFLFHSPQGQTGTCAAGRSKRSTKSSQAVHVGISWACNGASFDLVFPAVNGDGTSYNVFSFPRFLPYTKQLHVRGLSLFPNPSRSGRRSDELATDPQRA